MGTEPFIIVSPCDGSRNLRVEGAEADHLTRTLRARFGFRFIGINGRGEGWLAEVADSSKGIVVANIIEPLPAPPVPRVAISVALGVVKGSRMDWAVEKCCELGAERIVPLITRFGEITPSPGKLEHWGAVAIAAAKQSRRMTLTVIAKATPFETAMDDALRTGAALAFDLDRTPHDSISVVLRRIEAGKLTLLIGPEGGFSDAERLMLDRRGISSISFGAHPLRTETAAVLALGMATVLLNE